MSRLSDIAKKAVGNGGLTSGLEKMKLDDVIKTYPNCVTITGAELITAGGSTFPVFTFAEDETKYFSGGKALREMVEAWIEDYDGDLSAVNADLQVEPVRIRMRKTTTKAGRSFTDVGILPSLPTRIATKAANNPNYNPDTGEVADESDPF